MKKVTISLSIERTNTVYTYTPLSGAALVRPEKTQSGVRKISVMHALLDKCESNIPDVGDLCTIYGESGSGDCVLSQKSTSKEGGAGATPYTNESLVFIGL